MPFVSTDEEERARKLQEEAAEEYKTLCAAPDSDGLDFVAGTSQAIAFERMLESSRSDRLFNDPLAQHFVGERGERISRMVNNSLSAIYQIDAVHVIWTAVRTKFINDTIQSWIAKEMTRCEGNQLQVTNLGCGMDTRVFWLDALKECSKYIEVDVESVNAFKENKLREIANLAETKPLCTRQVINMEFGKERVNDLIKHGYDTSLPTMHILEGLVMYMKKPEVEQLIVDLADMSAKGSSIVVNFFNGPEGTASNIDFIEAMLVQRGWHGTQACLGSARINFGRWPEDKAPVSSMGFGVYFS
eukprot:Clim_evm47s99 gene=Clim_evmTU47s99